MVMEGDLILGGDSLELYTWNLYKFINQYHPNKFNKKF